MSDSPETAFCYVTQEATVPANGWGVTSHIATSRELAAARANKATPEGTRLWYCNEKREGQANAKILEVTPVAVVDSMVGLEIP